MKIFMPSSFWSYNQKRRDSTARTIFPTFLLSHWLFPLLISCIWPFGGHFANIFFPTAKHSQSERKDPWCLSLTSLLLLYKSGRHVTWLAPSTQKSQIESSGPTHSQEVSSHFSYRQQSSSFSCGIFHGICWHTFLSSLYSIKLKYKWT